MWCSKWKWTVLLALCVLVFAGQMLLLLLRNDRSEAAASSLAWVSASPYSPYSPYSPFTRPTTIKEGETMYGLEFERANLVQEDPAGSSPHRLAGALFFCREELGKLLLSSSSSSASSSSVAPQTTTSAASSSSSWPAEGYACYADEWTKLASDEIQDAESHAQWDVWLCKEKPQRQSVIRLRKRDCALPLSSSSSSSSSSEALWNRTSDALIGPEDFVLVLEGAEVLDLATQRRHLGQCQYETRFQLHVPGTYRLHMTWTRTNHLATKETPVWPEAFVKYPLGSQRGVFIDFSDGERGGEDEAALQRVLTGHGLPDCSSDNPPGVRGRWVYSAAGTSFSAAEYLVPRAVPGRREGYMAYVVPEDYTWTPYTCRLHPLRHYVDKCDIRNFTLFGDSHGRIFFQGLLVELCGGDESVLQQYSSDPWQSMRFDFSNCTGFQPNKKKTRDWSYRGIFSGDDWGKVTRTLLGGDHRVLANFGQHLCQQPSSFAGQYEHQLDLMLRGTAKLASSLGRRLAWFQTPAFPHDLGGFVRGYRDGRTAGRITVLNHLFDTRLQELGVPVSPLLHLTLPFYTSFADRAHFPRWVYVHTARVAFSQYCN